MTPEHKVKSLIAQTKNLQRQIKSMTAWNKRLEEMLLEVSKNNCSTIFWEAKTYKETLFRLTSRLANDGKVHGRADDKFLVPEIMQKAAELQDAILKFGKTKCCYDVGEGKKLIK